MHFYVLSLVSKHLHFIFTWTEGTHSCLSLLFLAALLQLEQALDTGALGQLGGPAGLILASSRTPQAACHPGKAGPSSASWSTSR